MKSLVLIVALIVADVAIAGGGGGDHGPVNWTKVVIYPLINFVVLFGALIFKLTKPISNSFTENSQNVEELFNHAEEKDKEAQHKYNEFKTKLDNVEGHAQKLLEDADKEIKTFDSTHTKEIEEAIVRLDKESKDKLEHEKKALMGEVNNQLLDLVVSKAKEAVQGDKGKQQKITSNLLSNI